MGIHGVMLLPSHVVLPQQRFPRSSHGNGRHLELPDRLSELLLRVECGEKVAISNRGVPFATIVPLPRQRTNQTRLGCLAGSVTVKGVLTEPAIPASDWDVMD